MSFDCFANHDVDNEVYESEMYAFLGKLNDSAWNWYDEIEDVEENPCSIGMIPVALIPDFQNGSSELQEDLLYTLVGQAEIELTEKGTIDKEEFIAKWGSILEAHQVDYNEAVKLDFRMKTAQSSRAIVGIHDLFPVNVRYAHSTSMDMEEMNIELDKFKKAVHCYQRMIEAYNFAHDVKQVEEAKRDNDCILHPFFLEEHCMYFFRELLKARIGTWLLENCQYWMF